MRFFLAFAGICLSFLAGASAARGASAEAATDKVAMTLYTQYDEVSPQQNMGILLKFKMTPGWHIFGPNPGEIAMPTQIKWQLPDGFAVEEIGWSRDREFVADEIVQRGYGETAYYQALIRPAALGENKAEFTVSAKWLACGEECVPEQKTLTLVLPATEHKQQPTKQWEQELSAAETWFMPDQNSQTTVSLWWILLLALGGGIIMNAMPCVFPILALKVLALVRSPSGNARQNRLEALCYMAGVVISFLSMAALLMWLRLKGEHIGWGFQLQSPWFVGIMAVLFIVIGLMFLDVIVIKDKFAAIGAGKFGGPSFNAFITGLLAVLIASPCTAPFMGVAIGYALSAPVTVYYPVFLCLGLGYALPFVLAGLFPRFIHRILPKPGQWMDILKKVFAIPVFLTAAWLLWVLYYQLKPQSTEALRWQKYDAEVVESLVEKHQPVFIDFTAKWCLTCLMNKRSSLDTKDFARLAEEHHLVLFRADWTNSDAAVSKALEAYGRNSVPLYVYYDGKSKDYKILPQILTPGIIKKSLD